MPVTHVVGAGLSGLSCAVRLAAAGAPVALYEAAGQAGGRCRSFFDDTLGCEIDNGNHLLLSGNRAALSYLEAVGARDSLLAPAEAIFPFVDLASGERWAVRPGPGRSPRWLLEPSRRVPGSRARDYLAALRLAVAGERTVAACLDNGSPVFRRFWEPLAVAVLNTAAEEAAARLLWPVLVQTFGRGEAACRPCIARSGLSQSFVDPALAHLAHKGVPVRFGARLRALEVAGGRCCGLDFGGATVALAPDERVVLALPPAGTASMLPGLSVPRASRAIVNAHFRVPGAGAHADRTLSGKFLLGMVGGEAHWLFVRGDIVSVTVSAAGALVDAPAPEVARRLWADVARALALPPAPEPPCRVVKEKRATFAQTPAEIRRRPAARTEFVNVFLAGDWTATGLPATIEGAVRSGEIAARAALAAG